MIGKETADMNTQNSDIKMISAVMFRLLPIQILLSAIGAINSVVSSLFASNYLGVEAMSAIGLYGPLNMFAGAISTMLVGGATILSGKYMGRNEIDNVQNVFALDNTAALLVSGSLAAVYFVLGFFDLTGFLSKDTVTRQIFNPYLIGQAFGVVPMMLANQLAAFLSLENKRKTTTIASLASIAATTLLDVLFLHVLKLGVFGLALASVLGRWVFAGIQAQVYFSGRSQLHFSFRGFRRDEFGEIIKIGFPGAVGYGYQSLRGILVNLMIVHFVGSVGLSALAACDSVMNFFWAIPGGMVAVSRMMISVSIGEEDRQTLADVMRTALFRFVPLMAAVAAFIILMAVPFTCTMYRDPSDPVYSMTIRGFRILPLCMPLSVICMHFTCYGQASGKHVLVNILAALDGVVSVAGFTALLIRAVGMNSVYIANVLNGVVTTLVIVLYSCIRNRHFPKNMEELMVIPKEFGIPESERMDLSLRSMEQVMETSQEVERFCREKGIDERRARYAALFTEEMAGNMVDHGFPKDRWENSVDVRVGHKDGALILRLKDNCVPFDPAERWKMMDPERPEKNLGIRMVYAMAQEIQYQNILGMNVLTIRI